jgi:hypothetical protein
MALIVLNKLPLIYLFYVLKIFLGILEVIIVFAEEPIIYLNAVAKVETQ